MNILNEIIEYKRKIVENQISRSDVSIEEMALTAKAMPEVNSFISALENKPEQKMALIAEVKKASPSKGLIRPDFKPVEIALSYQKAGACAISVLTDEKYFQGSIEYLKQVKKAVDIPILRKDFIVDPFQIYQTRLMGADIILLIASALRLMTMKDYYDLAKEIGLDVLVEVHNRRELEFALDMGAKLIGINNRNLETFDVSINTTIELLKEVNHQDRFIISESGINTYKDIELLKQAGISGVLVGESLMRQADVEAAIKGLLMNYL